MQKHKFFHKASLQLQHLAVIGARYGMLPHITPQESASKLVRRPCRTSAGPYKRWAIQGSGPRWLVIDKGFLQFASSPFMAFIGGHDRRQLQWLGFPSGELVIKGALLVWGFQVHLQDFPGLYNG
ncbi:hypothetical protein VOLCADRAFT_91565 [Volvox carteri f. nagariensis]|uniref:Uncharacterized protein n=1 Tax=Volvox carteri f. nagariensis TaxID=3068 RepID=D8TXE7_VOLCA|nr:uncharacterized protein VOLCADRAFT_91565 [Volvox carteri f. nagariensis]EFJ47897.1 hypothetical protein VOLCADRAFT_91565 [Volvox carteri f. nagariensis]|eukprot:XP_002951003.1 hypothetical protein VOLCADRAFT_91565 [Volvox carteri f. nagariensis]